MTIRNLGGIFDPESVALIGASPRDGSIGATIARNLLQEPGKPVWLVNPKYDRIGDTVCYPDAAALPGKPDLAVIATPPQTIPGIVRASAQAGARAAVVITAGLGHDITGQMLSAAQPTCLRLIGPNCLGVIMPHAGINASFAHRPALKGDIAFVSQSGALVTAVLDWASSRGIGFSQIVSAGDMADVDFGDLLDYLAGDIRSRAILLYIESITHAPKFLSAARRASRAKPVIAIKAGRRSAGARAAASHTGALAGADAAYDAAFQRAGVLRVFDLIELFEGLEVLSKLSPISHERVAILTNGGGAGVLATDRLEDLGGHLATISEPAIAALNERLPSNWSKGNPVDIIGDADADRYAAALETLLEDDGSDAIIALNCPTAVVSSLEVARAITGVVDRRKRAGRAVKPVLTNWLGEESALSSRELFASKGIPTFETPGSAVRGYMQLARYSRAQQQLTRTPPLGQGPASHDPGAAQAVMEDALRAGRSILSETEAKAVLAAYGVPVVPTTEAATPGEVHAQALEILGKHDACVVKVLSDDITHKSDIGGVRLNLDSADKARTAAQEILDRVHDTMPSAKVRGFTVQPMIRRKQAHELLLGISVDPTFGPVVMFGAGGTSVEVVADTAMALPPLDRLLARDLIADTRISRLLAGYRDRAAANMDALIDSLIAVADLAASQPSLRELDINPLLCDAEGVIALDARVSVADPVTHPRVPLAIRPYPAQWRKAVEIEGLEQIEIRPIRPEDERLYAAFLDHTLAEDLRLRFFAPAKQLSHRFLARLTQIDYAREMAFIALSAAGELLGVARLIADPDYERAEYAVLVRSDFKGRGIGWALMRQLIDYARAEGLKTLDGSVLQGNRTMLDMCERLGFDITIDPEDSGARRVELKLSPR
ncbi:MAG: GNAT family N-acetyltransferase [Hyphomicrobiales bacterium]